MPNPKQPSTPWRQLVGHAMMGTALGVLCAGLLLIIQNPALGSVFDRPDAWGRLFFLIALSLPFGLCATLTGALFLAFERS